MDYTVSMLCFFAILAFVFSFLAVKERHLTKAVVYSAAQSTAFALMFYLLRASDIVLVYIPVSVALYPAALLYLIRKTEDEE